MIYAPAPVTTDLNIRCNLLFLDFSFSFFASYLISLPSFYSFKFSRPFYSCYKNLVMRIVTRVLCTLYYKQQKMRDVPTEGLLPTVSQPLSYLHIDCLRPSFSCAAHPKCITNRNMRRQTATATTERAFFSRISSTAMDRTQKLHLHTEYTNICLVLQKCMRHKHFCSYPDQNDVYKVVL